MYFRITVCKAFNRVYDDKTHFLQCCGNLTIKQGICQSVRLSVRYFHITRTAHPIHITIARFAAEDARKCSVQFGAIWATVTFTMNVSPSWINSEHCYVHVSTLASWLCNLKLGSHVIHPSHVISRASRRKQNGDQLGAATCRSITLRWAKKQKQNVNKSGLVGTCGQFAS